MDAAISDLNSQITPNFSATAKKYKINRSTLVRRYKGVTRSRSKIASETKRLLTDTQERVLIDYCTKLSNRGIHPTPQILRNLVEEIIKHPVGEAWIRRFQKRHDTELASVYLRSIDQSRKIADNTRHFESYFTTVRSPSSFIVRNNSFIVQNNNILYQLRRIIETYHIKPQNTYNFDEKGFLLGLCQTRKRIVPRQHLRTKSTLGTIQDGSREFISLLATICADGTALPPALIYQGASYDLQDSWLEDYDSSYEEAYFATSQKGWTNEELGLSWLTKIFEPRTKQKAGNLKRLLIVDGHSSHINMRFIEFCDQHRIILVVLPPHSTHRLQPLDVGIFAPLAAAYSNQINKVIQSSSGFSRTTKRSFWPMFRNAWNEAVIRTNIHSAFAATGIYPLTPEKVLHQLVRTPPQTPPDDAKLPAKTPSSVRAVRRTIKAFRKENTTVQDCLNKMVHASEKLAITNEILAHENAGLREALVHEKKRRTRGKAMGLVDKNEAGQAQFFSPTKIAAVRARKEEIEAQKEQEKVQKEQEKRIKAFKREQREQEAKKLREEKKEARTKKATQLQEEKEARAAQKATVKQLQNEQKARTIVQKQATRAKKQEIVQKQPKKKEEPQMQVNRRGRNIELPERFRT